MSSLRLIDTNELKETIATSSVQTFLSAFARNGSKTYVTNLETRIMAVDVGEALLPITVNDAQYGDTFTCLPHSAYALYAKAELDFVETGASRRVMGTAADVLGALLKWSDVNRVVHVNNWLTSTNLHGRWSNGIVRDIRSCLVEKFPSHLFAVRSLSRWANSSLIEELVEDGWRLIPSRLIYVMDDPGAQLRERRNNREDLRLLQRSAEIVDNLRELSDRDAERISVLYQQLYLRKYPRFNPRFTAEFVRMTHASGVLRYRATRDLAGQVSAVVAASEDGSVFCPQLVAYDRSRPQSDGLYRMAMLLGLMMAAEARLRLNWSAGAEAFKSSRGGRAVVEYNAYYARHLPPKRRVGVSVLEWLVRKFVAPYVQRRLAGPLGTSALRAAPLSTRNDLEERWHEQQRQGC